jgi:hypothetical protein
MDCRHPQAIACAVRVWRRGNPHRRSEVWISCVIRYRWRKRAYKPAYLLLRFDTSSRLRMLPVPGVRLDVVVYVIGRLLDGHAWRMLDRSWTRRTEWYRVYAGVTGGSHEWLCQHTGNINVGA